MLHGCWSVIANMMSIEEWMNGKFLESQDVMAIVLQMEEDACKSLDCFFVVGTFRSAGCLDVYITVALLNKMLQTSGFVVNLPQEIDGARDLELTTISSELEAQVEHSNSRGISFVLERTTKCVVCIQTTAQLRLHCHAKISSKQALYY